MWETGVGGHFVALALQKKEGLGAEFRELNVRSAC